MIRSLGHIPVIVKKHELVQKVDVSLAQIVKL